MNYYLCVGHKQAVRANNMNEAREIAATHNLMIECWIGREMTVFVNSNNILSVRPFGRGWWILSPMEDVPLITQ